MAMNKMIQMIWCLIIVLFLFPHARLNASGKLLDETQQKERVKNSGWIGIFVQDVTGKIARKAKLESEEGAYVKEVVDNSPADSAGVRENDVIIEYNGKKLFDADELVKLIRRTLPGAKIDLTVIRDGQKKALHVVVGRKKISKHHTFGPMPGMPEMNICVHTNVLGMQLLTLNEQLGEYFGTPNNEGVLVQEVEHESSAENAGFKAGDIIIRVGKRPVDAVEKIQKELRKYDDGDKVEFEIMRKGAKLTLSIEMEEDQDIHKNFFFPKPHIRMFQMNPFDDADKDFEMDELRSSMDKAKSELRIAIESFHGIPNGISRQVKRLGLARPSHIQV